MACPSFVKELLRGTRHLVLPGLCEGCRRPLIARERVLCLPCCAALPQTGADFHHSGDNEVAQRLAGRIPFQNASAYGYFKAGGLMQHLLHRLKYQGRKEVGIFLGMQAAYAIAATQLSTGPDLIVPVPLHPRKERQRGFNQSAVIAEGLSEILQKPLNTNVLLRKKNTDSQTTKSRDERVLNMREAFCVSHAAKIAGRHVLLIDDVLTTGATLEAAAGALLRAEGVRISVLVIAVAM